MAQKTTGKQLSKPAKWLISLGTLWLIYTIVGFFVVPAVIKSQMLQRLPGLTKRVVSVKEVQFNPYVLSLTIDEFALKETNGDVFASFSQLYVNFQLSSIFKGGYVFDEISLRDPFGQVTYFKDGTFNFGNLLGTSANAPAPASAKPSAPPKIIVYHLDITNGAMAFEDHTRRSDYKARYQPINVHLSDFSTERDQSSGYHISAAGDSGESLTWEGNITIDPLRSSGTFRLNGLKLNRYKPYSQDYARLEVVDGQIDTGSDYSYDSSTNALNLVLTNAFVTLSRLQVQSTDPNEKVLEVPDLSVKQISMSLANRAAEVGEIHSANGTLLVRRNKDETINIPSYLILPKSVLVTNVVPANATSTAPWSARIDQVAFENYTIQLEDHVPGRPAVLTLGQLGFTVKNISNASNAPVDVSLAMHLQNSSTLAVDGSLNLQPLAADLKIGLTNIDLHLAQPYIDDHLHMAVADGALGLTGRVHYGGSPQVSFKGDLGITHFGVTDELFFDNLTKWESLDLTGIDVEVNPAKYHVDRIRFVGSETSAIMETNRQFNFLSIVPPTTNSTAPVAKTAPATHTASTKVPEITIGEFEFEKSSLHFVDRSVEPNAEFAIADSGGSLKDISSLVDKPSEVNVHGRFDQFSTFGIKGRLNPMPDKLFVDATVIFTNTGLTGLSPYTEKYVGRPLAKGKLSLDLRYKIDHQTLKATNTFFLDQLTLGAKNDSTNATKLPVKLAIALLKDRHGRIDLTVPLSGRLDDPSFKIGPIIWHVINNLITKAAVAPFSLLGSMFGGGEELSFIDFDPGSAVVSTNQTKKLDILTKALFERPTVSLEISGSVNPAMDRDALQQAKFERQIKALYLKEMAAAGQPPKDASEISLTETDYARLIPLAYSNAFGAYHATTNNAMGVAPVRTVATNVIATNKVVAVVAPPLNLYPRYHRGAYVLTHSRMAMPLPVVVSAKPASVIATTAPVTKSTGPVASVDDLTAMRMHLLEKTTVTSDDYRQVMVDRANAVEAYLLKSGKITADRLFLTAPRPVNAQSKGDDRVNLTLD